MKQILLTILLVPGFVSAQLTNPPSDMLYKKGMYGLKVSNNGRFIGSMAGDAGVYDIETGQLYDYWGTQLGLGNCVADNGMAVGDSQDHATLMFQGQIIYPEVFNDYWFCDLQAITPDATRLVGIINNPGRGQRYLPVYCDIDASGTVGEINVLPYPTKDFFGSSPQYSSAVWISNDGKTICGEMVDGRGLYTVPIVYTESETGEWSYYLPSEQLFNPTDLPLPSRNNSGTTTPAPPNPVYTDYMSDIAKLAYETAYEQWIESGYQESLYPNPENYMTQEQIEAYNEASRKYNDWLKENEGSLKSYNEAYLDILKTSPNFAQNEFALHPAGEFMMSYGALLDDNYEDIPYIYKFSLPGPDYQIINLPEPFAPYPGQILEDGTAIAATRLMEVPTSFVIEEGAEELVPFYDYIASPYPQACEWLELNMPGGSGVVSMSQDKSVIVGALMPGQLSDFDYEFSDFYYSTYILIPGSDIGGVETIVGETAEGAFTVYNLQGVKVMETKTAGDLNNLGKGFYIINGKKVLVK